MNTAFSKRASGILLHLTSLANRYPIGDLGPSAYAFADFLCCAGQTYWQMLPIGPTGMGNSPYDGPSAIAGNPLLISPDSLLDQGLLQPNDITSSIARNTGFVCYPDALRWKHTLLQIAFERFKINQSTASQALLAEFIARESYWLDDFALYMAIQEKEGTANWTKWHKALRLRDSDAMSHMKETLARTIEYHQFNQWQFALQWGALRDYCNRIGIHLIGDIPLFVAHQSADVWAHPELFKLDARGEPTVVAGVPPDYFSTTGQLWNVPVYCWERHQQQQYTWWIQRVLNALRRFDVLRLDHFIGFVQTYEIPAHASTACEGMYQPGGGIGVFHALQDAIGSLPFIAEDLGAKTPEVDALRMQLQIPGMRVLQFESSNNPIAYSEHAVIYTGTHDNDTIIGWFQSLSVHEQIQFKTQLDDHILDINWAFINKALSSNAEIAIIPMQDLLGLNHRARMNVPGSATGNWQWRLKKNELCESLANKLGVLTSSVGR